MFMLLMKTKIKIVDFLLLTFNLYDSFLVLSLSTLRPVTARGSYIVKGITVICVEFKRFGVVWTSVLIFKESVL